MSKRFCQKKVWEKAFVIKRLTRLSADKRMRDELYRVDTGPDSNEIELERLIGFDKATSLIGRSMLAWRGHV